MFFDSWTCFVSIRRHVIDDQLEHAGALDMLPWESYCYEKVCNFVQQISYNSSAAQFKKKLLAVIFCF